MLIAPELATAKPYLLRAIYDWCVDQGLTPYMVVFVDGEVQVPLEFVRDNEITLNIGLEATNSLQITNDRVEFKARFGGTPRQVCVPVTHIMAIFGRENGQGMAFPIADPTQQPVELAGTPPMGVGAGAIAPKLAATPVVEKGKAKPTLRRVK